MVALGFELKQCGSRALSANLVLKTTPVLGCTTVGGAFSSPLHWVPIMKMERLWLDFHTSSLQLAVAVNCSHN